MGINYHSTVLDFKTLLSARTLIQSTTLKTQFRSRLLRANPWEPPAKRSFEVAHSSREKNCTVFSPPPQPEDRTDPGWFRVPTRWSVPRGSHRALARSWSCPQDDLQSEMGDGAKTPPAPPCSVSKPLDGSQSQGHRILLLVQTYMHKRLNVFFPSAEFLLQKTGLLGIFSLPSSVDAM